MENIFSSISNNTIIEIIDNESMNKSIEEIIYFKIYSNLPFFGICPLKIILFLFH